LAVFGELSEVVVCGGAADAATASFVGAVCIDTMVKEIAEKKI